MALGQWWCCAVFDTRAHVLYCMETMVSIALYKVTYIHMDTVQTQLYRHTCVMVHRYTIYQGHMAIQSQRGHVYATQ